MRSSTYRYSLVAEVLDKKEASCRKIAQRAREHVEKRKPRYEVDEKQKERLVACFFEAVETGDPDKFAQALADDATLYSDGGDEVAYAAKRPIYGSDRITRFMLGIRRQTTDEVYLRRVRVGGSPGFLVYVSGRLQSAWSFDVHDGAIRAVYVVVNPNKLRHLPECGNDLPRSTSS